MENTNGLWFLALSVLGAFMNPVATVRGWLGSRRTPPGDHPANDTDTWNGYQNAHPPVRTRDSDLR